MAAPPRQAPPPPPPPAPAPTPAPEPEPAPVPPAPTAVTRQEAINRLLLGLAAREQAMAHLLNAEAEKVAQVAADSFRPESFDDLLSFQRTVAEIMQAFVRKEEVLLRKLSALATLCAEERQAAPPAPAATYDSSSEVQWAPRFGGGQPE